MRPDEHEAERAALRAYIGPDWLELAEALDRLDAVRTLVDKWVAEDTCGCGGCARCTLVDCWVPELRAALDGDPT